MNIKFIFLYQQPYQKGIEGLFKKNLIHINKTTFTFSFILWPIFIIIIIYFYIY